MDDENREEEPLIQPTRHVTYWTRWYVITMVSVANLLNIFLKIYWGPIAQSAKIVYDWYVLMVVSLANFLNLFLSVFWGPIAQSAKSAYYNWSDNTILILLNLGTIIAFFSVLAGSYLIDRKGIRFSTLVCCFCLVVCTASKITLTDDKSAATVLIGIGQMFNGFALSITGAIPPAVSEVWFPFEERSTATAIAALAGGLGGAANFIIGPIAVAMPALNGSTVISNETDVASIRSQLDTLNTAVFGVSIAMLFLCLVYLPSHPPTPPSITATSDRLDFKKGILSLIRRPVMWQLGLMYGLSIGSVFTWGSVLDILVNSLGISQVEAGWLGFYGGVGGVIGGLVIGRIADIFKRRLKVLLMIDCLLVASFYGWFTLQANTILPMSRGTFYTSVIGGLVMATSTIPLFIELTCEASYPIAAGMTAGFLAMIINLTTVVSLLINLIPSVGTSWMNWWVTATYILLVPLFLLLKVRYQRIDVESGIGDIQHTFDIN